MMSSIFFRLLNVSVVGALLWYLYRLYGAKKVRQGIDEHNAKTAQLNAQVHQMQEEVENAQHALKEQERLIAQLHEGLLRWSAARAQEREVRMRQEQERAQVSAARVARHAYQAALIKTQRTLAPRVIARARSELKEVYSSEHDGRLFIEHLMQRLRKGK